MCTIIFYKHTSRIAARERGGTPLYVVVPPTSTESNRIESTCGSLLSVVLKMWFENQFLGTAPFPLNDDDNDCSLPHYWVGQAFRIK